MLLKKTASRILPLRLKLWLRAQLRPPNRWAEIEEELLPILVDHSRASVDAGANYGRYTELLAVQSKHVYAFEPEPHFARIIADKHLPNVTVHAAALSDRDGQAVLHIPKVEQTGLGNVALASLRPDADDREHIEIMVETRRLDELKDQPIGYVKIDVEGHEREVLEGGRALLSQQRPVVQVELVEECRSGAVAWAQRFFAEISYYGFFVYRRRAYPIEALDPSMTRAEELSRPVPRKEMDYVCNFLFAPSETARRALCAEINGFLAS